MAYKCWQSGVDRGAVRVQAESLDIAATMFARLSLGPPAAARDTASVIVLVEDDALHPDTFVFRVARAIGAGEIRWLATREGVLAPAFSRPVLAHTGPSRLS